MKDIQWLVQIFNTSKKTVECRLHRDELRKAIEDNQLQE